MNILVFSHTPLWEVHHAETIEICLKEISKGNKIFLLSCDGALKSCPANAFKNEQLCNKCSKQTNYSVTNVLRNKVEDVRLRLTDECRIKSNEFQTLNDVLNFRFSDIPYGEMVASQVVDTFSNAFISLYELHQRGFPDVHSLVNNAMALYAASIEIIETYKIDEVYAWNGRRFCDGPVLYAAKNSGINYYAYISGAKRNSYVIIQALKVHDLESSKKKIEVTYQNTVAKYGFEYAQKMADEFFYKTRYGSFDYQGASNFNLSNLDHPDSSSDIVIFPGSYWEYFGMGDFTHKFYPNPYDGLYQILTDKLLPKDKKIIIRWHPNLINAGAEEQNLIETVILKTTGHNILHYNPSSKVNSFSLIENAKVVVTFGSSLGIVANYYGKPSVLLGKMTYEDLGITYNPSSHKQVMTLLRTNLDAHPRLGSIKYGVSQLDADVNEFAFISQPRNGEYYLNNKRLAKISYLHSLKYFFIRHVPVATVGFLKRLFAP